MPDVINTELAGLTVHIQGEAVTFDKDGKGSISKEKAYRAALELHNFQPAPEPEQKPEEKDEAPKEDDKKPVEEKVDGEEKKDAEEPKEAPKATPAKKAPAKK